MTVFDDSFENAFTMLLSQFGEAVVYRNSAGTERSINAIVDRSPSEYYSPAGDVVTPFAEIRTHDDATLGITASELNTGTDEIQIVVKTADTANLQWRPLMHLLSGGGGVTRIRVR